VYGLKRLKREEAGFGSVEEVLEIRYVSGSATGSIDL
jgi:hypothetical protein